jgi:hypothetical protein
MRNLIIMLTISLFFLMGCEPKNSNDQIISDIKAKITNFLPLGSTYEQVELFLDNGNIEHSTLLGKEPPYLIYAKIKKMPPRLHFYVVRNDIQIIFYFDKEQKLTNYEFKEILTGP